MSEATILRGDCARCAALCCVALAMDQSSSFAIDKPAGEVCPNLTDCGQCGIHQNLSYLGFSGCSVYDCLGAGQRVTQDVFGGRHWQEDRRLLEPMSRAFAVMTRIHSMLEVLTAADALPLDPAERSTLTKFFEALEPQEGWSQATLEALPVTLIAAEVDNFLRSLTRHARQN